MFSMDARIKWVNASLEVSDSKDSGRLETARGVWKAFWLAPKLEEESSVDEFIRTFKEE